MTEERLAKIKALLDRRQPDLTVLMESVNKPHNLSAILRTCDAVGVLEAHAVPPNKGLPSLEEDLSLQGRTFNDTSASAAKWVFLQTHKTTADAFGHLRARGFKVYAAHLSESAVDYRTVDYTRPSCILLGAEKWGVSEEAANSADGHIIVPMFGMVQSLNVSVAAAVVLFEAQRQRLEAGFYDQPRLSIEHYQALLELYQQRHAEGKG
ncbi:MAG: tRNA (guanosine(18)-2'-O)-methyltransferase TrmH [Meiothermus sp.]|nr:tRNA (guanosine(18)-2'-O)-methyltransferase TrmH [Meiothermus sp.]